VKLFFLPQRGVFECALARGQCSAVRAVHQTVGMQDFEILAYRNLRGFEMAAKFSDQDAALAVEQFDDGATTFFVEHWNLIWWRSRLGLEPGRKLLWRISFYSVLFRLSTGKEGMRRGRFGRGLVN
jgi:hypothetical protein